jgi:hypothetical protein
MGKCKTLQEPPSKASRSFFSRWLTGTKQSQPAAAAAGEEGCSPPAAAAELHSHMIDMTKEDDNVEKVDMAWH